MIDAKLQIPDRLKPAGGRFGCGLSKVRPEAFVVDPARRSLLVDTADVEALTACADRVVGTMA
jgi:hypothetical protein